MISLDISIILGWLCWISYNISHRNAWGLYTNRQRIWYNKTRHLTGVGPPIQIYGLYPLIILPLFVLSAWAYTRTFEYSALYITSILLIIIAITFDKIWNVLHFDRRDPRAALIVAFLCIIFYLSSVFTVGFTKRPNNEWENFPLMTILIINTLWFIYQFYIDSIYQTYTGLGMTRYEASHNKNIK